MKPIDNNTLSRLKIVLIKEQLSNKELAEILEITPQFVSQMLNGKKNISKKTLGKISERFNLSIVWLTTGKGEIYNSSITSGEYSTFNMTVIEYVIAVHHFREALAVQAVMNDNAEKEIARLSSEVEELKRDMKEFKTNCDHVCKFNQLGLAQELL